ncbi:hypothetical protein H0H81_004006, partial [Sphagnurus paluster]
MLFLSDVPGRFPVGATTFLTRARSPHIVGSLKLSKNVLEPALKLEEVAFTAYYPADTSRPTRKGLDWLIRPVKDSLDGFVKFSNLPYWVLWPVVYIFGALIKIPVYLNAPLAHPGKAGLPRGDKMQWPMVIFSHGLGGSRTAYSQICTRMAASGKVVISMEHRDGTGPCISRIQGANGTYQEKSRLYYNDDDIFFDDIAENASPLPLRTDQLEFRREEIYMAYQVFCQFLQNNPSELDTIDNSQIDYTSWTSVDPSGKGPICFDANITLAGHSFGGCTVLSILSSNPPPEYTHLPITHALILDPWLEPLPEPGPLPLETLRQGALIDNDKTHPQMLVINSEVFTLWKDHYARLENIMRVWEPQGKRILTL